ncbi:MAG: hypothetical protein LBP22_11825 [Deltaproteobacteria bacterium]|jgi:hypothetical protein|nr:hypothetical protein [Deltaproteobacteria bacterium]
MGRIFPWPRNHFIKILLTALLGELAFLYFCVSWLSLPTGYFGPLFARIFILLQSRRSYFAAARGEILKGKTAKGVLPQAKAKSNKNELNSLVPLLPWAHNALNLFGNVEAPVMSVRRQVTLTPEEMAQLE